MIDLGTTPGARFFRDGETLKFAFVIDAASVVGPRDANEQDKTAHPIAWGEFIASEGIGPLDHDADGEKGGSLPRRRGPARKVSHEPADDRSERL